MLWNAQQRIKSKCVCAHRILKVKKSCNLEFKTERLALISVFTPLYHHCLPTINQWHGILSLEIWILRVSDFSWDIANLFFPPDPIRLIFFSPLFSTRVWFSKCEPLFPPHIQSSNSGHVTFEACRVAMKPAEGSYWHDECASRGKNRGLFKERVKAEGWVWDVQQILQTSEAACRRLYYCHRPGGFPLG